MRHATKSRELKRTLLFVFAGCVCSPGSDVCADVLFSSPAPDQSIGTPNGGGEDSNEAANGVTRASKSAEAEQLQAHVSLWDNCFEHRFLHPFNSHLERVEELVLVCSWAKSPQTPQTHVFSFK